MLELEPCQHRSLFMWAQSLCVVTLNMCLLRTACAKQWAIRFADWHINSPLEYTFHRFQSDRCVYVKLPVSNSLLAAGMFYVGSTSLTMEKREANRQAKLRMLRRRKVIKAEPVLRYWHSKGNANKFVTIVLAHSVRFHLSIEHQLTAMWQPKLNHPFITKFFKMKTFGLGKVKVRPSLAYKFNAKRLFNRHRARHARQSKPSIPPTLKIMWDVIFDLASHTKKEFTTTASLRSSKWTRDDLYLLWRVLQNVEEPHCSFVKSKLAKVFKFRQLQKPQYNLALAVPFLSHLQFKSQVSKFMRSHILQCKDQWLPFHIPTDAIREKPHQKLAKALHNHFQWEETVTPVSDASQLPCSCKEFPSITRHGEHIAASLSEFGKYIPSVPSFALSISGNSQQRLLLFENCVL